MTMKRLRAPIRSVLLLLGVVCFGYLAALPAGAQTNDWTSMRANSFAPTVPVAQAQCRRAGLSVAECDEFAQKLQNGQYQQVQVPDNTVYERMNFARNGQPSVQGNTRKRLGENTAALRVTLSSGQVLDWYTGYEEACNNVGILKRPPPPPAPNCRWVDAGRRDLPDIVAAVPDFVSCGCYIPGTYARIDGGTASRQVYVCDAPSN